MKLAHKLALALLLGVLTVVTALAAWRVRREVTLLDSDMLRDHRLLSLTAAAAIVPNGSADDAVEVVRRIDASRENVTFRFVSFAPDALEERRPLLSSRPEALRPGGAPAQRFSELPPFPPRSGAPETTERHLVTYVGTPVRDDPHGAIQLSEPLAPRAKYVRETVVTTLASSVLMLLVCGAIVASIGTRIVGRPVEQLIAAARQIGAGHFSVVAPVTRNDELGELARAFTQMSEQLAEERARSRAEAEARIITLEQLRHAERLATLGQLASVLAHEIGTPVNVIAGHAKLIATGRLSGSAAEESAAAIGAQCDRMTRIVRRILDFARRKPGRPEEVELTELVKSTSELLEPLAVSQGVTLAVRCPNEKVRIVADPDQLQQVVTNVTLNAIQASRQGGTVEVLVDRMRSRPPAAIEEVDCVLVRVTDRGVGMSDEEMTRAFEPFFTTKPPGQGTGLGLSIVREIVEEHGGWTSVSSSRGDGTRFELHFPESATDAS